MIGDGKCDTACLAEACNYDRTDCGCSPGCIVANYGMCTFACLVPDCGYDNCVMYVDQIIALGWQVTSRKLDTPFNFARDCASLAPSCYYANLYDAIYNNYCNPACDKCVHSYGTCRSAPFYPGCFWGFGSKFGECIQCSLNKQQIYTYCVDRCTRSLPRHRVYPKLCYPAKDTSSPSAPDMIYVTAAGLGSDAGTASNPYHSLSVAFAQNFMAYSVIVLLDGTHDFLHVDKMTPEGVLLDDTYRPLMNSFTNKALRVTTHFCTGSGDHPECASARATIRLADLKVVVDVQYSVTFDKVNIDGWVSLVSGCVAPECYYCPNVIENGGIVNDRGEPLAANAYAKQSICDSFKSTSLFVVTATGALTLSEVDISNIRFQLQAIIYNNQGSVSLSKVNFKDIVVQLGSGAVVLQDVCAGDSYDCGSFSYQEGRVAYLNNGYEYASSLALGGFLYADGLRDILLVAVVFEKNVAINPREDFPIAGLVTLKRFRTLTIQDCVFEANISSFLIIVKSPDLTLAKRVDPVSNVVDFAVEHFYLKGSKFVRNLSEMSLISTTHAKDLQNFKIESCTFVKNIAIISPLISVTYSGKLTNSITIGETKAVALPNGAKVLGYFAPRHVHVLSAEFTSNLGSALFAFKNVANVRIANDVLFTDNGASKTETYNEIILQAFFDDPLAYIRKTQDGQIAQCLAVLSLESCYAVSITAAAFRKNYCDGGPSGFSAAKIAASLELSALTFSDNESDTAQGSVVTLADIPFAIAITQAVFLRNTNTHFLGMGVLHFGQSLSVSISDCQFRGNQVAAGAALWAQDSPKLSITGSTFDRNSATEGNGGTIVSYVGSGATLATLDVSGCEFTSNESRKAKGGSIVVSSDKMTRPYRVTILNCKAAGNTAASIGAALFIDTAVALTSDSSVQSCSFTGNISLRGTVALFYAAGVLSVRFCTFTSNQSLAGAGISSAVQKAASVVVTETSFASNTSPGGVVSLFDMDIPKTLLTSKCVFRDTTGVAVSVQYGNWTDSESYFEGNSASAIALSDKAEAVVTLSRFQGNSAGNGGAAYVSTGSQLNCSKCKFVKNYASNAGGALFLEQGSFLDISDSVFDSNSCRDKGSAIFLLGSLSPSSRISRTSFTSNVAGNSGVISLLTSSLALASVSFDRNAAKGISPGVVLTLSSLTAKDSTFSNQSGQLGAFVYATTDSTAIFRNSSFENGSAQSGGAFNILASSLSLSECRLSNLTAVSGAGFYMFSQGTLSLSKVTMTSLVATDSAIGFISEGTLTLIGSFFADFASGGVQADKALSVTIEDSVFSGGAGTMGGAFACTRCREVTIQGSVFRDNRANWGGAVYLTTLADAKVGSAYRILATAFGNNSAWRGGAAYSDNVSLLYRNCSFANNTASKPADTNLIATGDWGRGGGAMADCKDVAECGFDFVDCVFTQNSAQVSGGGIAWQDVRPTLSNCSFTGNRAEYGRNISSFAVSLRLLESSRRLSLLPSVASGQVANQSLALALIDHYGEVLTADNTSSAELLSVDPLTTVISGITKVTAAQGLFTFDRFVITAEPGTQAEVRIQTSAINPGKAAKAKDSVEYSPVISLTAKMRECVLGESRVGKTCQVCEFGKYSIDPTSTACLACLPEAICYGNFTMVPRTGYWRARVDTDFFYQCLYVPACTGSPEPPSALSLTGKCATGYEGNLCQTCSAGFSRTGKYECALCPELAVNIVRLTFIGLGVALLAAVIVFTTIRSAHRQKSLSSIYIKILMNYLQIVILAASFNLAWPEQVKQLFSVQETAGSFTEQAFSMDCLLAPDDNRRDDVVFQKLIVMAVIPLAIAFVSLIAWVCIYGYRRQKGFQKDGLIATIIILLFLAHPTLTKYFFNVFTCMDVDGQYYLLQQLNIKCWDRAHVFYVVTCAMPSIVLWVIGIPAVCLVYLSKHRRRLTDLSIKIRLGFLFNGYRAKASYWEFVILYRKVLIICCSVFLTTISIPMQALCVMLVLVVAMYLQDLVQPFTTKELNRMELKSVICATVTIYCGLFFLTGDLGTAAKFGLFIAIVVANAVFLWDWVRKMFGFYVLLAITKVSFLRRRFAKKPQAIDGFGEEFAAKKYSQAAFPLPVRGQRRKSDTESASLLTMRDMYLMKLRHESAIVRGDLTPQETIEAGVIAPPSTRKGRESKVLQLWQQEDTDVMGTTEVNEISLSDESFAVEERKTPVSEDSRFILSVREKE